MPRTRFFAFELPRNESKPILVPNRTCRFRAGPALELCPSLALRLTALSFSSRPALNQIISQTADIGFDLICRSVRPHDLDTLGIVPGDLEIACPYAPLKSYTF